MRSKFSRSCRAKSASDVDWPEGAGAVAMVSPDVLVELDEACGLDGGAEFGGGGDTGGFGARPPNLSMRPATFPPDAGASASSRRTTPGESWRSNDTLPSAVVDTTGARRINSPS